MDIKFVPTRLCPEISRFNIKILISEFPVTLPPKKKCGVDGHTSNLRVWRH